MALQIESGTGKGYALGVTKQNQALVRAEIHELQHYVSINAGEVYQAIGSVADIANGTNTLLHIRNNSTILKAIISYTRLQIPGAAGDGVTILPDDGTRFILGRNTTYVSGGVEVDPVNMNFSKGNVADLTVYKESPVVAGTFVEFDRWYPDHSMETFNKHGSLILGLNDTFEIRLETDNAALALAYCRVTIMLKENGDR